MAPDGAPAAEIVYQRPKLAPYQLDAFFHDDRYGLIEASTKSGKTHGGLCWLFEKAAASKRRNRNFYWVAPVYTQAKVAYRRLRRAIPSALRVPNNSELTLSLPWNENNIVFRSGEDPDNLYSDDVDAAVIDEASRLRAESFHAVRSTITSTGGPLRIIGNVKGRKNWFYNLCRKAEANEPGMRFRRITALHAVAAGIIKPEEVEDAKKVLPEKVFNELFMAQPNDDGGNPFGLSFIAACVKAISHAAAVCYGVDLAKSVDWTVLTGLDYFGNVCDFHRFQKPWKETKEEIWRIVGNKPALVDSTGVGDPVLEGLQRDDGIKPNFEGFNFSLGSKQKIIEGLAVDIQQQETSYPEGVIRSELESFEYEYTRTGVRYTAPEGLHDDCVYSLALARSKYRATHGQRPTSSWGGQTTNAPRPSWAR